MSKPPDSFIKLTDTLSISEFQGGGSKGFWLYDQTRGMNLSMQAKTEREAFVEALTYYQRRLSTVEKEHRFLTDAVEAFVSKVNPPDDN